MRMIILKGERVTKRFGALTAVNNVDFQLNQGEILGLIGPNGAGKSTLIDLITRVTPLDAGRITFKGIPISHLPPYKIPHLGIGRTFQINRPFSRMSVIENVALGAFFGRDGGLTEKHAAFAEADKWLEFVGLQGVRNALITEINIADRKRMDMAKALAARPDVLLLDEVMAGLNTRDVEMVMDLVIRVNRTGKSILIIEHIMKAVMGVCHRVMVLHHGEKIAEGEPKQIACDERVIKAYLGERYGRKSSEGLLEGGGECGVPTSINP